MPEKREIVKRKASLEGTLEQGQILAEFHRLELIHLN
jgi:hypothetical protein